MFEQLENLLNQRNYGAAAAVLGFFGKVLRPRAQNAAMDFSGAQVRVLPLKNMVHVFIVVDQHQEWWNCPGHLEVTKNEGDLRLLEKSIELPPHLDAEYSRHIRLHFIHVQDDAHCALMA